MTPRTLLSIEEFAALPDDGMKHELNEGKLIAMPPPKPRHGDCQARLTTALVEFVSSRSVGRVFTESGYRLTPDTVRGPDIPSSVPRAFRAPTNISMERRISR